MTTIVALNLDQQVTEELLFELIFQYTAPKYISFPQNIETQKHYGKAFIEFYTEQQAVNVVKIFDGIKLYDQQIKLQIQQKQKQCIFEVYVNKLTNQVKNIANLFGNNQINENFVQFSDFNNAKNFILKINNQFIDGCLIKADFRK